MFKANLGRIGKAFGSVGVERGDRESDDVGEEEIREGGRDELLEAMVRQRKRRVSLTG